jgi:hypothetical protein
MYSVTRLDIVHRIFEIIELKYKTVAGKKHC